MSEDARIALVRPENLVAAAASLVESSAKKTEPINPRGEIYGDKSSWVLSEEFPGREVGPTFVQYRSNRRALLRLARVVDRPGFGKSDEGLTNAQERGQTHLLLSGSRSWGIVRDGRG